MGFCEPPATLCEAEGLRGASMDLQRAPVESGSSFLFMHQGGGKTVSCLPVATMGSSKGAVPIQGSMCLQTSF